MNIEITKENYEDAVKSSSGSCLVADAIKKQHPQYTNVAVDVATIRFTDKEKGERYIYLTPPRAYDTLLYFDQGWTEKSLPKTIRLREPIKILPVTRSASSVRAGAERRVARRVELEAKVEKGETLTEKEKASLTRLQNPKRKRERPTTYGPSTFERIEGDHVVIRGGAPAKHAKDNPNLLHSRNRLFGAKKAEPSEVFKDAVGQAVKQAVKADRAKRRKS